MTGLLISVRGADEAEIALRGGADLIDVKEPARGPLGRAKGSVIRDVVSQVAGRVPVSAALGELVQQPFFFDGPFPGEVQYVKLGLAACGTRADWPDQWRRVIRSLPFQPSTVAVLYADWRSAGAPPPGEVLDHALDCRCAGVLVDTYDKSLGSLLEHVDVPWLADLVGQCRRHGLMIVLAGSLTEADLPVLLPLRPDYVALRGAVCSGGRTGDINLGRVRSFAGLLNVCQLVRKHPLVKVVPHTTSP